jgi:hypothetical protein
MKLTKKIVITVLVLANAGVLILLLSALNVGHANQLTISDLDYEAVDVDGDGEYTVGDKLALEMLLKNHPDHVNEALKQAREIQDGGIDLSPYLMSAEFKK